MKTQDKIKQDLKRKREERLAAETAAGGPAPPAIPQPPRLEPLSAEEAVPSAKAGSQPPATAPERASLELPIDRLLPDVSENGTHQKPLPAPPRPPPENIIQFQERRPQPEPRHKLPQDIDAERGVLCSILQKPERCLPIAERTIGTEYFLHPSHQVIWSGLTEMHRDGALIEFRTLTKYLEDTKRLPTAGGSAYVTELSYFVETSANIDYYLDRVREMHSRRQIIKISQEAARDANAVASPIDLIDRVSAEFQALRSIGGRNGALPNATPLIDFGDQEPDPSLTLLGDRFLCPEGGMLLIGPSGIGKTTVSVQQDLQWSAGKPSFGIRPSRPFKILTIQAEDDAGDLSEIVRGVVNGLGLSDSDILESRERCHYVSSKCYTGQEFLTKVVRPLLAKHRPDILRINPLLAYLGGDVMNTEVTAAFLRNGLNPLLEEFQCAAIVVHHTPKTNFRNTEEWKASDWMYAGAGAADITNWCRAAVVIDPTSNPHVFRFIAAKRGKRIGWVNEFSGEAEYSRHFAHGTGGIYWRPASEEEVGGLTQKANKDKKQPKDLWAFIPEKGSIQKDALISKAGENGIGRDRAKGLLAALIADGLAFEWHIPRPRTNPEKHIARYEQTFV